MTTPKTLTINVHALGNGREAYTPACTDSRDILPKHPSKQQLIQLQTLGYNIKYTYNGRPS